MDLRPNVRVWARRASLSRRKRNDRLRAHKREDESFTDTILRLTRGDRDVMTGFGAMADVEGFREAVESAREELDSDLRERHRR